MSANETKVVPDALLALEVAIDAATNTRVTLHLTRARQLLTALSSTGGGKPRPTDDELWDQTLKERDHYHDMADRLADCIADITGVDIGEHSSMNCPWHEATAAAQDYVGNPVNGIELRNALSAAVEWARPMEEAPRASCPDWFHMAKAALAKPASQRVPEGYVLVPERPTGDMLDAMLDPWLQSGGTERDCLTSAWSGALAGAPSPAAAALVADDAAVERAVKAIAAHWFHVNETKLPLELAEELASLALNLSDIEIPQTPEPMHIPVTRDEE
jgi:hypothetical protein